MKALLLIAIYCVPDMIIEAQNILENVFSAQIKKELA